MWKFLQCKPIPRDLLRCGSGFVLKVSKHVRATSTMNTGNKTTYKRADGETTQWEDIHRKLGNFAPAEPVWKPDAFEPEEDLGKGKAWIDNQDVPELEELEDEFPDDQFLQEYRSI